MATEVFGPLLPLQLDSRNINDVVRAIQSRIFIESGGKLTDFTPASPLAAISEGHGFAQAELLYYLNSLPEAVTVQWLRNLGIQRRIGSRAFAEITFYKIPGYTRPVTIPSGTKLYANGGQVYTLLEQVTILNDSSTATAQSERWGSVYNVDVGSITKIEKNYLGLESLTNLQPVTGGTDLETIQEMKYRAFQLFGRRNLTSRSDIESEVRSVAPESALVKVMSYEERFGDNSRGLFIVAGGEDGKALSATSQSLILSSIRNRVPLDVKIYLASPSIIPVEAVVNIVWDPRLTTDFTDFLASGVKTVLSDLISPISLGLGSDIRMSKALREILNLTFVQEIPVLDIKEMVLNPNPSETLDGACGKFAGTEDEENNTCAYEYAQIISKDSVTPLQCPSTTSGFRLYRAIISLTSIVDASTLTYTYESLYAVQ